jgi:hypothetical protein
VLLAWTRKRSKRYAANRSCTIAAPPLDCARPRESFVPSARKVSADVTSNSNVNIAKNASSRPTNSCRGATGQRSLRDSDALLEPGGLCAPWSRGERLPKAFVLRPDRRCSEEPEGEALASKHRLAQNSTKQRWDVKPTAFRFSYRQY